MKINGDMVFRARLRLGMSLRDFEQLTGVSKSTLSRIESGSGQVHVSTVGKIAKAVGEKAEDFIVVEGVGTTN